MKVIKKLRGEAAQIPPPPPPHLESVPTALILYNVKTVKHKIKVCLMGFEWVLKITFGKSSQYD